METPISSSEAPLLNLPVLADGSELNTTKPLSKNAQKKAAKLALMAERKLEKRAREKEAKKERKRIRAEKHAADEPDEEEEERRRAKKRQKRQPFQASIIVDLGFDELMSDKEIASLCSQLAYTYSANRHALYPFATLIFSSLNGRTFTRLENMNESSYKRWSNTEWWHEGYERLWTPLPENGGSDEGSKSEKVKNSIVYLTADSDEELLELKEGETYIVGGICDHNRYKNLCVNKAKAVNMRTGRLPIGRFLAHMSTRKVLTVNQVVEILLKWVETHDWETAFYTVMPKRKFQNKGKNVDQATEADEEQYSAGPVECLQSGDGAEMFVHSGIVKEKDDGVVF